MTEVTDAVATPLVWTTFLYLTTSATAQGGTYLSSRTLSSLPPRGLRECGYYPDSAAGIAGTYYIVASVNSGYSTFGYSATPGNSAISVAPSALFM